MAGALFLPEGDQPAIGTLHRRDRRRVVDAAGQPGLGGGAEQGAADGEAFADRLAGGQRQPGLQLLLRRVEAEDQHAAAQRIMLVDDGGQFMTQRQLPRMALIRTALDAQSLRVTAPGMDPLRVPLDGSDLSGTVENVVVWSATVPARAESGQANAWFSRFLDRPCRLFKVDLEARRTPNTEWVDRWFAAHPDLAADFEGDHVFGFADGYPVLVTNQASLDELNARLAAQGKSPASMNRFRPNVVVQGDDWAAWDEDHTVFLQAGAAGLAQDHGQVLAELGEVLLEEIAHLVAVLEDLLLVHHADDSGRRGGRNGVAGQ